MPKRNGFRRNEIRRMWCTGANTETSAGVKKGFPDQNNVSNSMTTGLRSRIFDIITVTPGVKP